MERHFLISDQQHKPLALAKLQSPPQDKMLLLEISRYEPNMPPNALSIQQKISLIDIDKDLAMEGTILNKGGDRLLVQPGQKLGPETRKNLRVRTSFESLLFPQEDTPWQGRRKFTSYDLSSGGIALQTEAPLECGQKIELVLPVMEPPLLVKATVLRPLPGNRLYAARFNDLTYDEDALIRKEVFAIQLKPR